MAARRPSPADLEIARLTAADEAANVAYTAALGRAYSLDLPEIEEEAAFAALRAAGVRCRDTNNALLAAIDARRDGVAAIHDSIIPQPSAISNSSGGRV